MRLDPETHTYTDDQGAEWPSVTTILGAVLGNQWEGVAGQYHLDRGRSVHALFDLLARGESLDDYDVAPDLLPYADQWRKWRAACNPEIIASESLVFHSAMRYAGTADLVATIGKRLCIVDYKATATFRDRWQLAAYALAYESMSKHLVQGLVSVQIRPDSWRMSPPITGSELAVVRREWQGIRTAFGCQCKEKAKG
jgi:hypothetical protein